MPRAPRDRRLPLWPAVLTGLWTVVLVISGPGTVIVLWEDYSSNPFDWEERTAQVLETEIRERSRGGDLVYEPRVLYRYESATGLEVRDRRIAHLSPQFETREEAEAWLEDYPVGGEVPMFVRGLQEKSPILIDPRPHSGTKLIVLGSLAVVSFLGLSVQLRRNGWMLLPGGKVRMGRRRRRPVRAAEPGEVHRGGLGYRKAARKKVRPIPGYRQYDFD